MPQENFTPQELQALRELLGMGGPSSAGTPQYADMQFRTPTAPLQHGQGSWIGGGYETTPVYGAGSYQGEGNYTPGVVESYRVTPWQEGQKSAQLEGVAYDKYSPSGQFTGSDTWKDMDTPWYLQADGRGALAVLSMPFAMAGLQAAGLAGGAAGSGAATGGAGGFIGEGVASGVGAWDAALANALPGSVGAGGATGAAFNAAKDSQLANAAIEAGGGNALSAYETAASAGGASGATGAGGAASALTRAASGLGGWLGPAATLLGGVLGSQQREQTQTQRNEIDPRMVPFLYEQNGVMPLAQQTMLRQMADPRFAANNARMRENAGFLLSRPVAQNGFLTNYGRN